MKEKKHKCHNCGKRRFERYMIPFVALQHGVDVRDIYPQKSSRQLWECGDCGEENRGRKSKVV